MSHSEPITIKAPDDESLQLPDSLAKLALPLLAGGVLVLLIGWGLGASAVEGIRYAMLAYLSAFMFCCTISLGSLFFVIIQHLTRAGWSATVRRTTELLANNVKLLAIMFLPILAAVWVAHLTHADSETSTMYQWQTAEFDAMGVAKAKQLYLNPWFFTVRAIFCFGSWILLARFFCGLSRLQDQTGEVKITERMQFWSGPGLIVFCLTASIAAFDWIMSLAPMWFSTMFGVYIFAGSILAAHATATALVYWFQSHGKVRDEFTVEHYHDMAKLIFGFIVFWAYISFSQYLLIWYANIPEETEWFFFRQSHGWATVSILLILAHWLLPFLALMSRTLRRRPGWVVGWALYILVMHFIDLFWAIMPQATHTLGPAGGGLGIVSVILCAVGMLALYMGCFLKQASEVPLIPARDPRLVESIGFENI
ncbi:hypothetical protein FF011L_13770 [Roseimaritima multifibrata]|uniref:Quinol:cytochrome C oxidoreductase n=1 Tax=Roseimaritima multifibrata TaxID=1930274 RepID=A0A517MCL2_9BACT|nr:hypothetical protein [Roseimaritima multifibrata]QDS92630.1 hypothetical protein FF011L_13770 [Roseimaritima multifibrata]